MDKGLLTAQVCTYYYCLSIGRYFARRSTWPWGEGDRGEARRCSAVTGISEAGLVALSDHNGMHRRLTDVHGHVIDQVIA